MKCSIKFVVLICNCFYSPNLDAQFCATPLAIVPLGGDCYAYTTCNVFGESLYPSNSMYLVTNNGVVMIDTPWDTTQLRPLLDSIKTRHGKEVVLCISTHFHSDRTAGVNFLKSKGIRTWSSHRTYNLCRERGEEQPEFYFNNDTVFTIGQYRVETYYGGGGHTPDNIVIWFAHNKLLYGGCLVKSTESPDLGNMGDARPDEWPQTIKNILKRFPKPGIVIPGHLGWKNSQSLQHTQKMLRVHHKRKQSKK